MKKLSVAYEFFVDTLNRAFGSGPEAIRTHKDDRQHYDTTVFSVLTGLAGFGAVTASYAYAGGGNLPDGAALGMISGIVTAAVTTVGHLSYRAGLRINEAMKDSLRFHDIDMGEVYRNRVSDLTTAMEQLGNIMSLRHDAAPLIREINEMERFFDLRIRDEVSFSGLDHDQQDRMYELNQALLVIQTALEDIKSERLANKDYRPLMVEELVSMIGENTATMRVLRDVEVENHMVGEHASIDEKTVEKAQRLIDTARDYERPGQQTRGIDTAKVSERIRSKWQEDFGL